jgi:hypothetical protein
MGYVDTGGIDLTRSLREQIQEDEASYFRRIDPHFSDSRPMPEEAKAKGKSQIQRGRITDEPNILDRYAGQKSWRDMSRHERHVAAREADKQLRQVQSQVRGFEEDRPTNSMVRFNEPQFKTQVPGLSSVPNTKLVMPREMLKNQGRHDGEDDPYGIKRPEPRILQPNGELFTGKQGMYANNRGLRTNLAKVSDAADASRGQLNKRQRDRMASQVLDDIQKDMIHNGLAKRRINLNMGLDQARVAYNWYKEHLKGGMTIEDSKKMRAGMKKSETEMKTLASQLEDVDMEVAKLVTDPYSKKRERKPDTRERKAIRKANKAQRAKISEAMETPLEGTKLGTEVGLKDFSMRPGYFNAAEEQVMSSKKKGKQKMPPTEQAGSSKDHERAVERYAGEKPIPPSDTTRQQARTEILEAKKNLDKGSIRQQLEDKTPKPPPRKIAPSGVGTSLTNLIPEEVGFTDDRMDEGFRDSYHYDHPSSMGKLASRLGKFLNSIILARRELKSSEAEDLYRKDALQDTAARIGEEGGQELTEFSPRNTISTVAGQATDQPVNHHDATAKRGGTAMNTREGFEAQVELWEKDPRAAEQKIRSLENKHNVAKADFNDNWRAPSKNGIMASIKRMGIPSVRGVAGGIGGFVTAMEFPEIMKAMGLNDQDMSRPVYDIASGSLSAGAAEAVTYKLATGAINMAKVAEGGVAGGVGMIVGDYATQAIETAWKLPPDPTVGDFQARDVTSDIAGGAAGAVAGGAATLGLSAAAGAFGIGAESAAAAVSASLGPVGWMVAAGIGLSAVFGAVFGTQQALTDEANFQKQLKAVKEQSNTQNKEYDYADHTMVLTSQYQAIADELSKYGASASLLSKIHTDWMSASENSNPQPMTQSEYNMTFRSYLSQLGGTTNVNAQKGSLSGAQIMEQQISNAYRERGSQLTALASQLKKYGATNIDPATADTGQPLTEAQFVTKYNGLLTKAGDSITSKHKLTTITVSGASSSGPKYNISSITPPTSLNAGDIQFYQDSIKGIMKKNADQTTYNQAVKQTKEQIVMIASQYYAEISHEDFKAIYTHITEDNRAMFALSFLTTDQRAKVIRNVMTNEDSIDGYTLTDTNGASTQASGLNTAFTDTAAPAFQQDYQTGQIFGTFQAPVDAKTGKGAIYPSNTVWGSYEGGIDGFNDSFGYQVASGHGGFLGIGVQYAKAQKITLGNMVYANS